MFSIFKTCSTDDCPNRPPAPYRICYPCKLKSSYKYVKCINCGDKKEATIWKICKPCKFKSRKCKICNKPSSDDIFCGEECFQLFNFKTDPYEQIKNWVPPQVKHPKP